MTDNYKNEGLMVRPTQVKPVEQEYVSPTTEKIEIENPKIAVEKMPTTDTKTTVIKTSRDLDENRELMKTSVWEALRRGASYEELRYGDGGEEKFDRYVQSFKLNAEQLQQIGFRQKDIARYDLTGARRILCKEEPAGNLEAAVNGAHSKGTSDEELYRTVTDNDIADDAIKIAALRKITDDETLVKVIRSKPLNYVFSDITIEAIRSIKDYRILYNEILDELHANRPRTIVSYLNSPFCNFPSSFLNMPIEDLEEIREEIRKRMNKPDVRFAYATAYEKVDALIKSKKIERAKKLTGEN